MFLCSDERVRSSERDPADGAAGLLHRAAGPESCGAQTGGPTEREAAAAPRRQREGAGGEEESPGEGRRGDPAAHRGPAVTHIKPSLHGELVPLLNFALLSTSGLTFSNFQFVLVTSPGCGGAAGGEGASGSRERRAVCSPAGAGEDTGR